MSKYYLALLAALLVLSCRKNDAASVPTIPTAADSVNVSVLVDSSGAPFPQSGVSSSPASCPVTPIYGDTIIYPQLLSSPNRMVNPVAGLSPGKFYSWPAGLALNSSSGAIDISKSETGMKYVIGYIAAGSKDTCLSYLTIGGASYTDSVYVLAQGDAYSTPYFDATPDQPGPCANNGCSFDLNNSAKVARVVIDKTSGIIDLAKTLNGEGSWGVFGPIPFDGEAIKVNISYRLNDTGNHEVQHAQVEFVYYQRLADVPADLLALINSRNHNLNDGTIISTTSTPRPPLVVIVRTN